MCLRENGVGLIGVGTNSKRLLIILYSNQFYSETTGSLVFSMMMSGYGKIPSILQISTMQNFNCLILT